MRAIRFEICNEYVTPKDIELSGFISDTLFGTEIEIDISEHTDSIETSIDGYVVEGEPDKMTAAFLRSVYNELPLSDEPAWFDAVLVELESCERVKFKDALRRCGFLHEAGALGIEEFRRLWGGSAHSNEIIGKRVAADTVWDDVLKVIDQIQRERAPAGRVEYNPEPPASMSVPLLTEDEERLLAVWREFRAVKAERAAQGKPTAMYVYDDTSVAYTGGGAPSNFLDALPGGCIMEPPRPAPTPSPWPARVKAGAEMMDQHAPFWWGVVKDVDVTSYHTDPVGQYLARINPKIEALEIIGFQDRWLGGREAEYLGLAALPHEVAEIGALWAEEIAARKLAQLG